MYSLTCLQLAVYWTMLDIGIIIKICSSLFLKFYIFVIEPLIMQCKNLLGLFYEIKLYNYIYI